MAEPVVFDFMLSVVSAVTSSVVSNELKAWGPRMTRGLISRAVLKLPEEQRARYNEEWLSYIDEIPGIFGKLVAAGGLLHAGFKLRSMFRRQSKVSAIRETIGKKDGLTPFVLREGATPEDVWQRMGTEGLWAMYQSARRLLEAANMLAEDDATVDPTLLQSVHNGAMQVRVCILTALAQHFLSKESQGVLINTFRAATIYSGLTTNMSRLLDVNK